MGKRGGVQEATGLSIKQERTGWTPVLYFGLAATVLVSAWSIRGSGWFPPPQAHALLETLCASTALTVGVMALIRNYTRKRATLFLVGTGFLGAALLDGYHAAVATSLIGPGPHVLDNAIAEWSWLASRFFLSILLAWSWLAWRRRDRGRTDGVSELRVFIEVGLFTLAFLLAAVQIHSPVGYLSGLALPWPVELIPALFFGLALVGFWRKGRWMYDPFEAWLIASLIVALAGQSVLVPSAANAYDAAAAAAQLVKLLSYVLMLIGVVVSLYWLFRQVESRGDSIASANESLRAEIANRQRAEEALRLNETKYRSILESVQEGYFEIDLEGAITFCNTALARILGYRRTELIGKHFREYTDGEQTRRLQHRFQSLAETGFSLDLFSWQIVRRDGERRYLESSISVILDGGGESIGFGGMVRDVTSRREAWNELERRGARLELLNSLAVKVRSGMSVDQVTEHAVKNLAGHFPGLRVAYCSINEDTLTVTHSAAPQGIQGVTGLQVDLGNAPDHLGPCLSCRACETGCPEGNRLAHIVEDLLDSPRGGVLVVPVRYSDRPAGVISVDSDSPREWSQCEIDVLNELADLLSLVLMETEAGERRDRAEAELEAHARQLARSNDELQQFAYVASHDLQEPLRMVAGYTQLLARRYEGQLDTEADTFIGYAVDGVRRMQQLIQDLLAYSRVELHGHEFQRVELMDSVDWALSNLETSLAEASGTVEFGDLPAIDGDPTQLGLLFQNLLGNAIKFRNGRNPSILIDSVREGSHWRIGVHDNGPGIEPQHRERIFQIFQRLKRSDEGGTGIGLAICKRIVNRHGGRIWVESAPGEGSSFYFTIPEGSMRSETKPATASPLLTEADADPDAVSHPHDANGRIKQNLETLQA